MEAVEHEEWTRAAAAALIGPNDDAAGLLLFPEDIAFAICRWGLLTPDDPTAWMSSLSPGQRDRLIHGVMWEPFHVARRLPWLPLGSAERTAIDCVTALRMFAEASDVAHERHAARLRKLITSFVQREDAWKWTHLVALTRLACAMKSEDVWRLVIALMKQAPREAAQVVLYVPWKDMPKTVQTTITSLAGLSNDCAVIAAAQGQEVAARVHSESAPSFFATLDPRVWNGLTADLQRACLDQLYDSERYFAVQSLGLRPDILARAEMNDGLIQAVRRHVRDDGELRTVLFPIALRDLPSDAAQIIWNALLQETKHSLHAHPATADLVKTFDTPAPHRRSR